MSDEPVPVRTDGEELSGEQVSNARAWWRRSGLPRLGAGRPLLAVMFVDAAGGGFFLPFSLLYFHIVGGLSLERAGAGLTTAGVASLLLTPLAGAVMDRWSARRLAVTAYLVRCLGFAGYLLVRGLVPLIITATLTATGERWYWTANGALVADVAGEESDRWFGLQRAIKNAGMGFGALIAGLAVQTAGHGGYRLLVILTSVAYLSAAALLRLLRLPASVPPEAQNHKDGGGSLSTSASTSAPERNPGVGFSAVLRDRRYLSFLAGNSVLVLFCYALNVAVPLYIIETLHSSAVLVGVVLILNGALITVAQLPVTARLEQYSRVRRLQLAAALWALSFAMLMALRAAPPSSVTVILLAAMTVFTLAEIVYAPTADAHAVRAASRVGLGRYLAAYQLSWGLAAAAAPLSYTALLSWNAQLMWLSLIAAGSLPILAGYAMNAENPVGAETG